MTDQERPDKAWGIRDPVCLALQAFQLFVQQGRPGSPDAGQAAQVVNTGGPHGLQAAEGLPTQPPRGRSDTGQAPYVAGKSGVTRSDFIRARALGYRPRRRLSEVELDGLRQLAACRTDMINFANALHGLTDDEKVRLFRHRPTMLEWYEKVAAVTDRVTDFLQSAQSANNYPAGTTDRPDKEDDA